MVSTLEGQTESDRVYTRRQNAAVVARATQATVSYMRTIHYNSYPRDATHSAVCIATASESVCHVEISWSHRLEMEFFENSLISWLISLGCSVSADPNITDLLQRK